MLEPVSVLGQEMVEPDTERVVLEDEGGADLVLGEAVGAENAGVSERLQELKLPAAPPARLSGGRPRCARPDEVKADAALGVENLDVARLPVLIARPFADDLFQHVVADLAVPLGGADPGLLHGLADDLGHRPVVRPPGVGSSPGHSRRITAARIPGRPARQRVPGPADRPGGERCPADRS